MEWKRCPDSRQTVFYPVTMCNLNDKPCLLETDGECPTYEDWLFEERQEELDRVGNRLELIRCQDCKYHHCYFGKDGQDCSCALSVFVTPTTNAPPSNCPLFGERQKELDRPEENRIIGLVPSWLQEFEKEAMYQEYIDEQT